jgi:hypothetical protein
MSRAGPKPQGPALVRHLEGSPLAKERLEVILQTLAGQLSVGEACQRLGIREAMFFKLRTKVLEAGLARLEPRPLGRPPHHRTAAEERSIELEQQVEELQAELKIAAVREEVAQVLHQEDARQPPVKKTTDAKSRRKRRRMRKKIRSQRRARQR